MKTLVLGATTNPSRYAYLAANSLLRHSHEIVLIGRQGGDIQGNAIHQEAIPIEDIHTVTLYLNPTNQKPYEDYIVSLKPKRVIFNPGTENPPFQKRLREEGIDPIEGCTLVMLAIGSYGR